MSRKKNLRRSQKLNLWALGFILASACCTSAVANGGGWGYGLAVGLLMIVGMLFFGWSLVVESREERQR